ncbi:1-phosphofructokinase family hexose kinase [Sanguibacter suaedae]|uniref:1-phosphofructokinase family hexose kinase n=1 Tax=Sanguibacter suaedae TaxID=2795737 RepID=A0A934M6C9_9MICO|nr:1-phosphofructokinase family hexose kinase [Sanguibacter suaedae]MBI9114102.1 1-phosphofructokinase family hexose kinase [Sanguibacter suaedae]
MIITLTPNPSLDRTYEVPTLVAGEVNRAVTTHVDAGGKGINVTRALAAGGARSVAIFPAGGTDGVRLVSDLEAVGVAVRPVPAGTATRSNIAVVDALGATTKINAPGEPLDPAVVTALLDALAAEIVAARSAGDRPVVVAAGSLPTGAGDDLYVRVARVAAEHGARTVVDSSGAPFREAVEAGGLALVKPNDDELAELVGRELRTVGDVTDAAREIISAGTDAVLVSLGAHGALLVTADSVLWAGGTPLVPLSTVGAGDTTLAGFLSVLDQDASSSQEDITARLPDALRVAVAWGRAAVLLPGSAVPTPDDVDVTDVQLVPDPSRRLALKEL